MAEIRLKLRQYLDAHNLSAYRLVREVEGISPNTIYAYAANRRKPTLHNLEKVLSALERLTGKPVSISDLLEVERTAPAGEAVQAKTPSWRDLVGLLDHTGDPSDMSVNHDTYIDDALWEEHQESTRGER